MVYKPIYKPIYEPVEKPIGYEVSDVVEPLPLPPLNILANIGTSDSLTATGLQALTGVGFQPKVVMPINVSLGGYKNTNQANLGFGVGTSPTERATVSVRSSDNVATSDTDRRHDNSKVLHGFSVAGTTRIEADLDSIDSDGFTLDWTAVDRNALDYGYICLGGADLEVSLTQHQMNNDNTPQSFAHGLSGAPTGLLFFGLGLNAAPPSTAHHAAKTIGFWDGANQAGAAVLSLTNLGTTSTARFLSNNAIAPTNWGAGPAISRSMAVSDVDSTNVNVVYPVSAVTFQNYFWMLAIRGAKCQVGTFDCNGSTSPLTISTTGITPKLFLPVFVPGGVDNINTVQNSNALTIGASNGTNTICYGITDEDNVATTNTRETQSNTTIKEYDFGGTLAFDGAVSFSGQSVVITPSINIGTTFGQGAYLVIGS
jgi:hypothetical protein